MKTLYLLRHGKSSWATPGIGDFQRPLKSRGLRAARLIGRHLRSTAMRPDLALCSPATRARQTLSAFMDGYDAGFESRIDEALYHASPEVIAERIRSVADAVRSIMVIGHNPGLQDMALILARDGGHARRVMEEKFPTAALAVLTCDRPCWSPLLPGSFTLREFFTPKTLLRFRRRL